MRRQVDIVITKDDFQTLAKIVIVNSTHIDLVQHAFTTTTHAIIIVA